MAQLLKRRKSWYSIVWLWNRETKVSKPKEFPLRTSEKKIARIRHSKIESVESEIKNGIDFSPPWLNDKGRLLVKNYKIEAAVNDFLKARSYSNLRKATMEQNKLAFRHFMYVVGKSKPVKSIAPSHIDDFKKCWQSKHSVATINMNLRAVKTLLIWLFDNDKIEKVPKVQQLPVDNSVPLYLTESQFNKIMKLDIIDEHVKEVFQFYRDTGCRRSEPFYSRLDDNWLIIPHEYAKTHEAREIELTKSQIDTILDMHKNRASFIEKKNWKQASDFYSREFKKACKIISLDAHFHCLRHTFAVMEYLRTRDIYAVSKKLGHKSVTTTEVYAQFNMRKLAHDFQSLRQDAYIAENVQNGLFPYTFAHTQPIVN